jgi:NAD(P)-dependent dehydrogenase (short-subunit alcohol dehydrogenase family)
MSADSRTLLVIGSGPGIGRSVSQLFAAKRFPNVILVARRSEQLETEKADLEAAVPEAKVKTYAVDITDLGALEDVLNETDAEFGTPECVFFNAARVQPSMLLSHSVQDIEYEFKVCFPISILISSIFTSSRLNAGSKLSF